MRDDLCCPSAQPEWRDAQAFGVVGGTTEEPRVAYLERAIDIADLPAVVSDRAITEVVRVAAPCAQAACRHFEGSTCTLASRLVNLLPAVVERAPRCPIRTRCLWFAQEGLAACQRCPQVVTDYATVDSTITLVATPIDG